MKYSCSRLILSTSGTSSLFGNSRGRIICAALFVIEQTNLDSGLKGSLLRGSFFPWITWKRKLVLLVGLGPCGLLLFTSRACGKFLLCMSVLFFYRVRSVLALENLHILPQLVLLFAICDDLYRIFVLKHYYFLMNRTMALRKYVPPCDASSAGMKPLSFSGRVKVNAQVTDPDQRKKMERNMDVDLKEVYFLIMHFLSAGPCHRTYGQLWNELLEHQLLPRRYHSWYSRTGRHSGDENDDGTSFPLSYNNLVDRYVMPFAHYRLLIDNSF